MQVKNKSYDGNLLLSLATILVVNKQCCLQKNITELKIKSSLLLLNNNNSALEIKSPLLWSIVTSTVKPFTRMQLKSTQNAVKQQRASRHSQDFT